MNGICILVPQANFSDGGFAKLATFPAPFLFLFLFYFFTVRVVGIAGYPLSSFQFVKGVLERG